MAFHIYFISDGTGITAESFGQSLLAQFEHIECIRTTRPYIDTIEKARRVCKELIDIQKITGQKPIVFSTIIDPDIARILHDINVHTYDIFDAFIPSLETLFNEVAVHQVGKKRAISESQQYDRRIEAVHFALDNDDGTHTKGYSQADIILVGVSRCGKTPTCLYLGLQFGIHAANYPLTDDDLNESKLPASLTRWKEKLFGLTIDPERLQAIRKERRPDSKYSSIRQCNYEVRQVEHLFQRFGIPQINTTHYSIEEIATRVLSESKIERRIK